MNFDQILQNCENCHETYLVDEKEAEWRVYCKSCYRKYIEDKYKNILDLNNEYQEKIVQDQKMKKQKVATPKKHELWNQLKQIVGSNIQLPQGYKYNELKSVEIILMINRAGENQQYKESLVKQQKQKRSKQPKMNVPVVDKIQGHINDYIVTHLQNYDVSTKQRRDVYDEKVLKNVTKELHNANVNPILYNKAGGQQYLLIHPSEKKQAEYGINKAINKFTKKGKKKFIYQNRPKLPQEHELHLYKNNPNLKMFEKHVKKQNSRYRPKTQKQIQKQIQKKHEQKKTYTIPEDQTKAIRDIIGDIQQWRPSREFY